MNINTFICKINEINIKIIQYVSLLLNSAIKQCGNELKLSTMSKKRQFNT